MAAAASAPCSADAPTAPPGRGRTVSRDDRLEVAALAAHAVFRHVDDAGVELVAQEHADRLRAERLVPAVPQAGGRRTAARICCFVKRPVA